MKNNKVNTHQRTYSNHCLARKCIVRLPLLLSTVMFSATAAQISSQNQGDIQTKSEQSKEASSSSPDDNGKPNSIEHEQSSIGQAPENNISHLFLRNSEVQLRPREIQITIGFDYSSDQNQRSFRDNRNRSFSVPFSISYGLTPTLEMNATLPYIYNKNEIISAIDASTNSKDGLGDFSLGISYKLKPESSTSPAVTTSLNIAAPTGQTADPEDLNGLSTGSGFWGVSPSIHLSKSVDPAVLFFNFGYQYTFDDDQHGSNIQPGAAFTYGFGAGLSVNNSVAFSGRLSGRYQKETKFDNELVQGSSAEPISFIGSVSFRFSKKERLESTFTLGISDDANDASMGFSYIRNL